MIGVDTMKDRPATIKAARIRCGFTQKELGLKMGHPESSADNIVRQWESGRRPVPIDKIRPLAAALNLTLDDLIP